METMAMEKTIVPRVLFNGDNGGSAVRTCFESGASGDDKALLIAFAKDMVMYSFRLYNVPPSTIMGSCRGCSSIQLPFGLFLCLLSEAKQHRKTGACII
ncbi:hypothetical protein Lal_00024859 [Lupinus albus]|nr:hypothetical protein Lal_00024859 [Lupinus albus]